MARLDASNVDVINTVRANASLAYRERVPETTKASLAATLDAIQSYEPFWNEFQSVLINKIALVVMDKNMTFENRLRPLKSGGLEYGGMVQELDAQLIEAQAYDPNATNVFEAQAPDVLVNYHKINRRDKYKFKVNSDLLEEAFLNDGQLSAYVNSLMVLPQQSSEWDEYKLMLELLAMYQSEGSGFANYQVPDIASAADAEAAGKNLTRMLREYYLYTKGFFRTQYNKDGAQAFSDELVLLTTPRVQSYLDVEVLANAFNMDKAQWLADRVVIVDEFPDELAGTQAMLLDSKFYRVYDAKRRAVSIFNPDTLDWIYTYHIWQILSASRMKNAIRFSTAADSIVVPTKPTVSSVSISAAANTFNKGDIIAIGATVTYSDGSTDAAAVYEITATAAGDEDNPVKVLPETGTYIDRMGNLHIAVDAQWTTITVTAYALENRTKNASKTITPAE